MLNYRSETTRYYENGVMIMYEIIDSENLYIYKIVSTIRKKKGRGTQALQEFMCSFKDYHIYLCASDELGTDKEVLYRWYEKLGFITSDDGKSLPFRASHWYKKQTVEN